MTPRLALVLLLTLPLAGCGGHADREGLPLVHLPADRPGDTAAVIISGDGGWAGIDRGIGNYLADHGVSVVGLNALRYFWVPRTPDGTARHLARLIATTLQEDGAHHVLLIGYSRGADVLPFVVPLLPDSLRRFVASVALVAPSRHASFEFHFIDLITSGKGSLDVVRAITGLRGIRVLCIYGVDDPDAACPHLPPEAARIVRMKGGHHLDGAYQEIAKRILRETTEK